MGTRDPISFNVNQCRRRFDSIFESFSQATNQCNVDVHCIKDEYGRFKLWAGSLGAHKIGAKSLDARLAESPRIHETVLSIVRNLEWALEQCECFGTTLIVEECSLFLSFAVKVNPHMVRRMCSEYSLLREDTFLSNAWQKESLSVFFRAP